jgi:riboflavin synthase
MFTGIVEETGIIRKISGENSNVRFTIACSFVNELKIDQSVSHNGICLTVVGINDDTYDVVAINETLQRSNINSLKEGDEINLERCTKVGDRLDGHIVQGHVDTTAVVKSITDQNGSWIFFFEYEDSKYITVEKGSICVNGVSLTVVESNEKSFSVAIIPYTFEHTNFKTFRIGDVVNLEFDIIGKYITRLIRVSKN